ncbi:hypothetical protein [Streptomyces sp. CA-106131]|uniref:hypothetical protein n=1 Tax=Streptomyces sp. CA-106131 TaxID=3240045 RepID=UPI003D8FC651
MRIDEALAVLHPRLAACQELVRSQVLIYFTEDGSELVACACFQRWVERSPL